MLVLSQAPMVSSHMPNIGMVSYTSFCGSGSDDVEVSLFQLPEAKLTDRSSVTRPDEAHARVGETTPRTALLVFGRRVATPCRRPSPECQLERAAPQSGARDGSPAVTETLFEAPLACTSSTSANAPTVISLADCLPVVSGPVSRPLQIGATLEELLSSVSCLSPDVFLQDLNTVVGLHPVARQWARDLPLWDGTTPTLDLFTDGSYQSDTGLAAWSAVATAHCSGCEVFVGFLGDRLWPPDHPHHVCQTQDDAHSAELAALLHAMACIASLDAVAVTINGDCTSALDIASASACSQAQSRLSRNEFADSVAKAVATSRMPRCELQCYGTTKKVCMVVVDCYVVVSFWCCSWPYRGGSDLARLLTFLAAFPPLPDPPRSSGCASRYFVSTETAC